MEVLEAASGEVATFRRMCWLKYKELHTKREHWTACPRSVAQLMAKKHHIDLEEYYCKKEENK